MSGRLPEVFRANKGRVWHAVAVKSTGTAECGARFRSYHTTPYVQVVTCPKCRRVLAERAALVPIAAALMSEYGE